MAEQLYDYQYELGGVVFGIGTPVTVEDGGFDPGTTSWRVQDSEMADADAMMFGRDYASPAPWAWNLSTDADSAESALHFASELFTAWQAIGVRDTPGAVMPLRYAIGHRTRRIYGRPRRWSAPPANRIIDGYMPITADFQRADTLHYDDVLQSSTVGLIAAVAGGLVSPLRAPLQTLRYLGPRAGSILVGGDTPTWPIITFQGPVYQPWVEVAGWRLDIQTTIPYDSTIVVDTRPWARTVLLNGDRFIPGILARRTRLNELALPPGAHEITYGGIDTTGSATVQVSWRDAYLSL